ncbi:MAG: PepSY-like domain-containing protein, partial [candidate division Zixibacteria bacterium]|nr:PepSY-like domain-containing protein [candidate division Zixibacteria bacterium]
MKAVTKLAALVTLVLLVVCGTAAAGDHDTAQDVKAPEAVLKAFRTAYPDLVIVSVDKDDDDGQVVYELETRKGDRDVDYVYRADGTLIQVEEEIPVAELPDVVRKAVEKAYPDSELDEAEKITRGPVIEFEVVAEVGETEYEVLLSADGKIISSTEMSEDDDG